MNTSAKRERDVGLDLVRVAATVMVVCGHYSFALGRRKVEGFTNFGAFYANGEWPLAAVSMFLALSGAVLWRRYQGCKDWRTFFKKRWLTLFPIFYIAWLAVYFFKVCQTGRLFWGGNPTKLLLTLVGMDNYFAYRVAGYGLVGEWFFGAIVFLYLLFPLLQWLFGRWPAATMAAALGAYGVLLFWYPLQIDPQRNLVTCVTLFLCGFCLERWPLARKPLWAVPALAMLAVLAKMPLGLPRPLGDTLTGLCLLAALRALGPLVERCAPVRRLTVWLSGYSFPVILVHHQIAVALAANIPAPFYLWRGSLFLALTLAASLGFGVALKVCSDRLVHTVGGLWAKHQGKEEKIWKTY